MTDGDKLLAINRLKIEDGLNYADHHDIGIWCDLCGAHFDTTVLSEKSKERIRAIFDKFYEQADWRASAK